MEPKHPKVTFLKQKAFMVLIITWRLEGAAGGVVSIGRPLGCIYPRSDEGAVDLGSRALPLTEDPSVRVRPGDESLL